MNNSADKPLVTLVLLTYNQEAYIWDAVAAACHQSYSPLEIIISDDCSSDRTFTVAQAAAAKYAGRHEVAVVRNAVNLGTALHIFHVAQKAKGELIICAAGDDISVPERCEQIVAEWERNGKPTCCIHSGATFFGENVTTEKVTPPRSESIITESKRVHALLSGSLPFLSPTCAYSRELFDGYEPPIGGSIIEDWFMATRSLVSGVLISIPMPLVRIRVLQESGGTGYSLGNPQRWNTFVLSRQISYATMLRDISTAPIDDKVKVRLQRKYLEAYRRLSKFLLCSGAKLDTGKRVRFFLRYLLCYPTTARLKNKVADGMAISGLADSMPYQMLYRLFSRAK